MLLERGPVQVAFSPDDGDREAILFMATTGALTGEWVGDLRAATLEYRTTLGRARPRVVDESC